MMPIKKGRNDIVSAFLKNWRQPTLAEPIGLLPSARLCLTAEFGKGSGRTTALWPPKIKRSMLTVKRYERVSHHKLLTTLNLRALAQTKFKRTCRRARGS